MDLYQRLLGRTENIVAGPSRQDFSDALFRGGMSKRENVYFKCTDPEGGHSHLVRIDSAQREDSSGEKYVFRGRLIVDGRVNMEVKGSYSTQYRNGEMQFDPPDGVSWVVVNRVGHSLIFHDFMGLYPSAGAAIKGIMKWEEQQLDDNPHFKTTPQWILQNRDGRDYINGATYIYSLHFCSPV
ncbi:MAG: hypothetical protein Q8R55_02270 [Candidatus Taylorbacteria bacterium]|nr:hypothetical protein [Candidatus Taylorbacteria bacterium]